MSETYPELDYYMSEGISDVVFVVDGQRVPALRDVLTIKSKVFEDLFSEIKSEEKVTEITVNDIDCEAFKTLIKWLYTERLDITDDKDIKSMGELMRIAVKYEIYRLIESINERIEKVLTIDNFEQYCKTCDEMQYKDMIPILRQYLYYNNEELKYHQKLSSSY